MDAGILWVDENTDLSEFRELLPRGTRFAQLGYETKVEIRKNQINGARFLQDSKRSSLLQNSFQQLAQTPLFLPA